MNRQQRRWAASLIIVTLAVMVSGTTVFGRQSQDQSESEEPSQEEVLRLTNSLLSATHPGMPENAHFPPLLREKLIWIADEYRAGRLKMSVSGLYYPFTSSGALSDELVESAFEGDMPVIGIRGPQVWRLIRGQDQSLAGFNERDVNSLAIALAHNAVHLENPRLNPGNRKEVIDEERRTLLRINRLIVIPLLVTNHPLGDYVVQVADILQRCGYNPDCQDFVDFVSSRVKQ